MRTKRSYLAGAMVAAMLLTACGESPGAAIPDGTTVASTSDYPTTPVHHLPPGVGVESLMLSPASVSISVGSTQQFTPTVKLTDGQTVYDPQLVQWSVGDPAAGSVDYTGVFTPTAPRTTNVSISLDGKTAEAAVTITPAVYSWQQVASPTSADLYAGKVISHNEAWAVGAQGTVLHFLGGQWQIYQGQGFDQGTTLRAIDFSDPSTGWMVGTEAPPGQTGVCVAYAYANGTWVPMPIQATGELRGVAVADRSNAWAVGQDASGKILIMHWAGQGWQRDTSVEDSGRLNAVQMMGDEVWAVGEDDNEPVILHYDGTAWSTNRLPITTGLFETGELRAICMLNQQQGYAVGEYQSPVGSNGFDVPKGLMLKYDSRGQNLFTWSNWTRMSAADTQVQYLDQVPLNGISMLGGGQGWVVGQTVNPQVWLPLSPINAVYGNFLDFDGTTYTIDNSYFKYNLSPTFNGIDVLPQGDGLVVGSQGYIMQRSYDWRQQSTLPSSSNTGTAAVPGTITGGTQY